MKLLKISSTIFSILPQFEARTFTVNDLTEAYLQSPASSASHSNKKFARQYVYRNLLRLVEQGMVKLEANVGRSRIYKLTDDSCIEHLAHSSSIYASHASATIEPVLDTHFIRKRLNQLKEEMLSAIGETDEYNFICSKLPEMQGDVQALYNQARDNCSRLLGRIKALETLLVLPNQS